jgi:carbamoyltransferase
VVHILGLSAFYHDSAACLIRDGEIIAAAQEERFSRKKHDARFPKSAVAYCLKEARITAKDVDYVAFYDKPLLKFFRILETYLGVAPLGLASFMKAMPTWLKEKLWMGDVIREELGGYEGKLLYGEHHESHAASAFYPCPWEKAAVLTIDGVGEWATTTFGMGDGNKLDILGEIRFPHSLGLLYSAFTYFTGFKVNSGEYKVMGLAPYGDETKAREYVKKILDNVFDLREDGSFRLNMEYFDYLSGLRMTSPKFAELIGGAPRQPESKLTQREMDLALTVQIITEMTMEKQALHVKKITGADHLCLAGGVALNCVSNGKLLRKNVFKDIWIQPAAGDAGGALGVALAVWHKYLEKPRMKTADGRDRMKGAYLGPKFSDAEIKAWLDAKKLPYEELTPEALPKRVAELMTQESKRPPLEDGTPGGTNVVGLMQGRMEFGPRALGGRSIIGDSRSRHMQKTMNVAIKFRESFRPFAPSCLAEKVSEVFELDRESPYMLIVAPVLEKHRIPMSAEQQKLFGIEKLNVVRSTIPSITHVDYSARIQTVHEKDNKLYHDIIAEFDKITGIPAIVNTSFNVRGEPIICNHEDAFRCFMRTHMDYLVLERFILDKTKMPDMGPDSDWRNEFELD